MGQANWPSTYRNVRTLQASALSQFGIIEVLPSNAVVGRYKTAWGSEVVVKLSDSLSVYGWKNKQFKPEIELSELKLPISDNQIVGSAKLDSGSVDLITDNSIKGPSIFWKITNFWSY